MAEKSNETPGFVINDLGGFCAALYSQVFFLSVQNSLHLAARAGDLTPQQVAAMLPDLVRAAEPEIRKRLRPIHPALYDHHWELWSADMSGTFGQA